MNTVEEHPPALGTGGLALPLPGTLQKNLLPLAAALSLTLAVGLAIAGRVAGVGNVAEVETFVLVFASIVIEALPFILLGALVSAAIAVYVPERFFERVGRLPLRMQLPAAAVGGLFFPVCECGSVPVARRLIARGVHPAAGVAFMLASPVLNPIVLVSTWVAYSGRGTALEMVLGRATAGLALAALVGIAFSRVSSQALLRSRGSALTPDSGAHAHGGHDHDHEHGHGHTSRGAEFVSHLTGDFRFMGRFIVIGASAAALLQTFVSQGIVSGIAGKAVLAPLALIGLAFMLSLCSEADAFVAVSLISFSPGAQLAFLVFGPMMDTKLAMLYGGTFRKQFALRVILVALPFLAIASLIFDALVQ